MRKIVSLIFVGLLLMSSLLAYAGGSDESYVHTLPQDCPREFSHKAPYQAPQPLL